MSLSLFVLSPPSEEERLQAFYDRLAARFGLGPARVRLSRRKLTGGHILYGSPHAITISAHLSLTEKEDTLRHEAAHAWAFEREGARSAHGRLFRRLARQMGARAGHAPETSALREFRKRGEIVYACEGCGGLFRRMRRFRGRRHCARCYRAGHPSRLRLLASTSERGTER